MKTLLLFSIPLSAAVSAMAQNSFPNDFVRIKGGADDFNVSGSLTTKFEVLK